MNLILVHKLKVPKIKDLLETETEKLSKYFWGILFCLTCISSVCVIVLKDKKVKFYINYYKFLEKRWIRR